MRKKRKSEPPPEPPTERERLSKRLEQLQIEHRRTIKQSEKFSISKRIKKIKDALASIAQSDPLPA